MKIFANEQHNEMERKLFGVLDWCGVDIDIDIEYRIESCLV